MRANQSETAVFHLANSIYFHSSFAYSFQSSIKTLIYNINGVSEFTYICNCTCRVSWIDKDGTKYLKEVVVVLQSLMMPIFGIIKDIVVHCADYFFVCNMLHTECFSSHFHAYEVSKTNDYILCTHSDLADHHVLDLYHLSSYTTGFIPVKYHLFKN